MMKRSLLLSHLATLVLFLIPQQGFAWIYPEHRDIAVIAIQDLAPTERAILDRLWADARKGYEGRLSEVVADTAQGLEPEFLDYAAWPAIAGDHSCSAGEMIRNVLETDWIMDVAAVTAELKADLDGVEEHYDRVNSLRKSDLSLQRVDPAYATRAGSNNVHFLIARSEVVTSPADYFRLCLAPGAELNGLAAYAWYHVTALYKASLLKNRELTEEDRSRITLAALADEAFALHFLEDAFAAGHAAGTWGDASLRKGTHDYYNEHGLEVSTWDRQGVILIGDAYMRDEDARRAAKAVRTSIEQLLATAAGTAPGLEVMDLGYPAHQPDNTNLCAHIHVPKFREVSDHDKELITKMIVEVMETTPIPGLKSGIGEHARFRAELGPFIGLAPATRSTAIGGGFGEGQQTAGYVPTVEAAVRMGLGLDGVMNEAGDGLVFLDLGFRLDGASTSSFIDSDLLSKYGSLAATVPGRSAFATRLRMPFWLIPGDLIFLSPILFFSPGTFANMAVQAGNGGLIPWQSGIATPIGRFQFVLGREVGVSLFGFIEQESSRFFFPTTNDVLIIGLKSIYFDFPVLEYRPFRTFSLDQSSGLVLQLNTGFDVPTGVDVIESFILGTPVDQIPQPELRTLWHVGLRLAFDWRYYY